MRCRLTSWEPPGAPVLGQVAQPSLNIQGKGAEGTVRRAAADGSADHIANSGRDSSRSGRRKNPTVPDGVNVLYTRNTYRNTTYLSHISLTQLHRSQRDDQERILQKDPRAVQVKFPRHGRPTTTEHLCQIRTQRCRFRTTGLVEAASGAAPQAETIEAEGASKRIEPDHTHHEITPAMTGHPLGATGTHWTIHHGGSRHAPFSFASRKITPVRGA